MTSWPPKDSPADAITPTADTTYTLSAYGRSGSQLGGDLQQTVTLVDAPKVSSLWAGDFLFPNLIWPVTAAVDGTPITLNWTTANADAVALTLGGAAAGQPVLGLAPGAPPPSTAPSGKATALVKRGANCFRITPSRGGVPGQPLDLTIGVTPLVTYIPPDPPTVPDDGALHDITLKWSIDDPDANLVITPQAGDVTGLTQKTVQAKVGDTFTLTATNPTTHAQGTFTFYVWGPPPPVDPNAPNPYAINLNLNFSILKI